jgi:hypothetical protein
MKVNRKLWRLFAGVSLISLGVSCSSLKPSPPVVTIVPERIVEQKEASWDGDVQNSGLLDYVEGRGFEVTKKALARYNALVFTLGSSLIPPIVQNDGVTIEGERIFLTPEAMVNFITLNQKFKNGRK